MIERCILLFVHYSSSHTSKVDAEESVTGAGVEQVLPPPPTRRAKASDATADVRDEGVRRMSASVVHPPPAPPKEGKVVAPKVPSHVVAKRQPHEPTVRRQQAKAASTTSSTRWR